MKTYDKMSNEEQIIYNKQLIEKYPFLYPRYAFSGEKVEDYDYTYTELDALPTGWRIAFSELICEDIKNELIKYDYLDKYQILQIKEKWGALRWYDNGTPQGCKVDDIISAYSVLSEYICIYCGQLNVPMIDDSWISPACEDCYVNKYNYYFDTDKTVLMQKRQKFWDKCYEDQYPITLPTTRSYRQYKPDSNEWELIIVDISEYTNKIINKYIELNYEN